MKKVIAVIGARPQFIKHAPIDLEAKGKLDLVTIHTGQHYDKNMSDVFFEQLKMTPPDYMLHIGSHSHGKQTGMMLEKIEEIILKESPDMMLVYGDTNSTLAGALAAVKLDVPVAHVEAGLRSFNKKMPEEINRIMTDHVSSLLFVPTDQGIENLAKEGIQKNVFRTGDIMYDMLLIAKESGIIETVVDQDAYYLATLHRPYNTNDPNRLKAIFNHLNDLDCPTKMPLHPRTKNLAQKFGIDLSRFSNLEILDPVSYFENIQLMANAKAIITDSGGMQKEAYFLQKKCITIRPETEWVETLINDWNHLIFEDLSEIQKFIHLIPGEYRYGLYGNGDASQEIIQGILDW